MTNKQSDAGEPIASITDKQSNHELSLEFELIPRSEQAFWIGLTTGRDQYLTARYHQETYLCRPALAFYIEGHDTTAGKEILSASDRMSSVIVSAR